MLLYFSFIHHSPPRSFVIGGKDKVAPNTEVIIPQKMMLTSNEFYSGWQSAPNMVPFPFGLWGDTSPAWDSTAS